MCNACRPAGNVSKCNVWRMARCDTLCVISVVKLHLHTTWDVKSTLMCNTEPELMRRE